MVDLLDGFNQKQKAAAFEMIAVRYYDKNFGTMTKSEFETLMFSICIENILLKNKDNQDDAISDYRLSKMLGVSQTKVRSLKIRKQLMYPRKEFDWRKSFAIYVNNARYEKISNKIFINILDPNVFIEVQQYIESFGGYIEKQLNQKLLVIRPEYLITLMIDFDDSIEETTVLDSISEHMKNEKNIHRKFSKENMPDILKSEGVKIALEAISLIPGGSLLKQVAHSLERIMELE